MSGLRRALRALCWLAIAAPVAACSDTTSRDQPGPTRAAPPLADAGALDAAAAPTLPPRMDAATAPALSAPDAGTQRPVRASADAAAAQSPAIAAADDAGDALASPVGDDAGQAPPRESGEDAGESQSPSPDAGLQPALWLGTRQLGIPESRAFAYALCVDALGNSYVTGPTYDGLDGNSALGSPDLFLMKLDATGTRQWTRQYGASDAGTAFALQPNAIACDAQAGVVVAGVTNGTLDGHALTGRTDVVALKYDASGGRLWVRMLGAAGAMSEATGVALDLHGNVFVTGFSDGLLAGSAMAGAVDAFVIEYDSDGTTLWTRQLGAPGGDTKGNAASTDAAGNIYLAGTTTGDLDGNAHAGASDLFVSSYDAAGTRRWTAQLGVAAAETSATGLVVAGSDLYIVGSTTGGLDGNAATGAQDAFIAGYTTAGAKRWTRQWGAQSGLVRGNGVTTRGAAIYACGVSFGALDHNVAVGSADAFVSAFDSAGTALWTRQFGSPGAPTFAAAVHTGPLDSAVVTGTTFGALDGNSRTGLADIFIAKFSAAGVKNGD